nr:MAG TPA: zonular occludens toxin [Inoviridae sp.]
MPIHLTTGVPGAGKTLYTVAKVLRPMVGETLEYQGKHVPRRLMIGGIPDLLLEHEPIDVQTIDPESYRDEWSSMRRDPGEPALDVPHRADNWWLWCQPGDLIVIDECQRLFRPFASGRKIPGFIAKLETHRHYGVDFVLITQHPQLLHTNVRNLVGRHQHVRRMFGGKGTIIYEWDHCTHPDKIKTAGVTYWRHDKSAFGLYKSAEVHTKPKVGAVWPIYVLAFAVLAFIGLGYRFYAKRLHPDQTPVVASAPGATVPLPGASIPIDTPKRRADLALFVAAHPGPPAPSELAPIPDHVAGCFVVGDRCQCVTTNPARIQEGYGRFCAAVMAGLFSIPPHRVATPSQAASVPAVSPVAAASGVPGGV